MSQSPTLFVSGATGQLGRLVVDALLRSGLAGAVMAGVRDPAKPEAVALRDKGAEVRVVDYARPDTLDRAFAGVDRLLLISGNEIGRRREQHRSVITAAKNAGVRLIAYTSILRADTSPLLMAEDHRDTEAALAESGVPFVLLRNGWYTENFTPRLPPAVARGTLDGASGDGRISAAARADYAEAAAAVLTGDGHAGQVYELAGDAAFTLAELASVAAEASGKPVAYRNITPDQYQAAAIAAGMPEPLARLLADAETGTAHGALFDEGGTLARLVGRPTTAFDGTVRSFLKHAAAAA